MGLYLGLVDSCLVFCLLTTLPRYGCDSSMISLTCSSCLELLWHSLLRLSSTIRWDQSKLHQRIGVCIGLKDSTSSRRIREMRSFISFHTSCTDISLQLRGLLRHDLTNPPTPGRSSWLIILKLQSNFFNALGGCNSSQAGRHISLGSGRRFPSQSSTCKKIRSLFLS